MGEVYKVRQRDLNRFAALKVIRSDKNSDAEFARRFDREAQAMAKLNHPNIVSVYDHGEASTGTEHYLLMEFVSGSTLRELIETGLDEVDCNELMQQICGAISYAHAKGVVHRDIKPENMLVDQNGQVKVADFGVARFVDQHQSRLTQTHQVVGTIGYIPPELFKGGSLDERADVFALGAMLYEILTGELPLGSFSPPSEKAGVDLRFDAIVARATAGNRDQRYSCVADFASDLRECSFEPGSTPSDVPHLPGPSTVLDRFASAALGMISPRYREQQNSKTVVEIHRTQLADGDLPNVCMVCGTHTRKRVAVTFRARPAWMLGVALLSIVLCFPIGIVVAALVYVSLSFSAPLCEEHRRHWSTLNWHSGAGWIPAAVVAICWINVPTCLLYTSDAADE